MLEAYFDETETHPNSSFICVAGYLFSKENALRFANLWNEKVKPLLPENVEVFHAVDCYARQKDFKKISERDRDAIFDAMISIIKDTIDFGIIVGVDRSEYESTIKEQQYIKCKIGTPIKKQQHIKRKIGTPYTLCALRCAEYVADWLLEQKIEGDVFYHFEAGHKNQGELDQFLKRISHSPARKQKYRLNNWDFRTKTEAVQLQAADLLSWEWQRSYATAYQPGCEKRKWRMTLKELAEKPHKAEHITPKGIIIKTIVNIFNQIEANPPKKRGF